MSVFFLGTKASCVHASDLKSDCRRLSTESPYGLRIYEPMRLLEFRPVIIWEMLQLQELRSPGVHRMCSHSTRTGGNWMYNRLQLHKNGVCPDWPLHELTVESVLLFQHKQDIFSIMLLNSETGRISDWLQIWVCAFLWLQHYVENIFSDR